MRFGDHARSVVGTASTKEHIVSAGHVSGTAVRGHAITFTGDPFFDDDTFVDIEDALILSQDTLCRWCGARGSMKLGVRRPPTSTDFGAG
jgi:hypothetical protein